MFLDPSVQNNCPCTSHAIQRNTSTVWCVTLLSSFAILAIVIGAFAIFSPLSSNCDHAWRHIQDFSHWCLSSDSHSVIITYSAVGIGLALYGIIHLIGQRWRCPYAPRLSPECVEGANEVAIPDGTYRIAIEPVPLGSGFRPVANISEAPVVVGGDVFLPLPLNPEIGSRSV